MSRCDSNCTHEGFKYILDGLYCVLYLSLCLLKKTEKKEKVTAGNANSFARRLSAMEDGC